MSIVELNAELITASPAPSDPELISRFVGARDQQALAELVRRHSPVVLGVCRRVLRDTNDIEDAFQATFLVLIRDARRVQKQASLASWLYGVAYRLSLQLARQKRRRRETPLVDDNLIDMGILASVADRHDHQLLDDELNALPERYRQPLVLRYLAGKATADVAKELGITVGAVEGLLKRGKDELRQRLLRRGVTLGAALVAVRLAQESTCAMASDALIESTVQAGLAWDFPSSQFLPEQLSTQQITTRALELAGKEVLIMTTGTKSVLTIGLTLGGLFAASSGVHYLGNSPQGNAEAAGLNSAMAVTSLPQNTINLAALTAAPAADPIATEVKQPSDPAEKSAPAASKDVPQAGANRKSGVGKAVNQTPADPADVAQSSPPGQSRWDLSNRGPRVQKIMSAFNDPAEANFVDVPLKEALDVIQNSHQIEIHLDVKRLSEEGVPTDTPVDLVVSGPNLKSVLRMLLDPLGLDYIIENEVLTITSRTHADDTYDTRVYRVEIIHDTDADELNEKMQGLMAIIQQVVAPTTWKQHRRGIGGGVAGGGLGGAVGVGMGGGGMGGGGLNPNVAPDKEQPGGSSGQGALMKIGNKLIVRQTHRVHEQIVDLLDQLEAQSANDAADAFKLQPGF